MLQDKQYVPLLKTGIAEIAAYRALYPDVKESLFPIFQFRPWPNANHLDFTVGKVRDAVEGHSFGLGLDLDRRGQHAQNLLKPSLTPYFSRD
jgi:hypothetical protein